MTGRTTAHNPVGGWALSRSDVIADLRRILGNTQRVATAGHSPEVVANAARNADTLTAAIRLLEAT